jgi:hypothetical protein
MFNTKPVFKVISVTLLTIAQVVGSITQGSRYLGAIGGGFGTGRNGDIGKSCYS